MSGGDVLEGEEGAEALCKGCRFGGEGFAEGGDGGVVCRSGRDGHVVGALGICFDGFVGRARRESSKMRDVVALNARSKAAG